MLVIRSPSATSRGTSSVPNYLGVREVDLKPDKETKKPAGMASMALTPLGDQSHLPAGALSE